MTKLRYLHVVTPVIFLDSTKLLHTSDSSLWIILLIAVTGKSEDPYSLSCVCLVVNTGFVLTVEYLLTLVATRVILCWTAASLSRYSLVEMVPSMVSMSKQLSASVCHSKEYLQTNRAHQRDEDKRQRCHQRIRIWKMTSSFNLYSKIKQHVCHKRSH